jgi:hypothetical protein
MTTAAMATYAYGQIGQARTKLEDVIYDMKLRIRG